jgi:hypothetical protein
MHLQPQHLSSLLLFGMACHGEAALPPQPAESVSANVPPVGQLLRPLEADVVGLTLADRIDIGIENDESSHGYSAEAGAFVPSKAFQLPRDGLPHVESGRSTKVSESLHSKVIPWSDHVLVKVFDPTVEGQTARVIVDGEDMGNWKFPADASKTYGEATFQISGGIIGDRSEVVLEFQHVDGAPDLTSYLYWVYAKPGNAIARPLVTDLTGLTQRDYLDVGNVENEIAHEYSIEGETFVGANDYTWNPDKVSYRETLRATRSFESFKLEVSPGRDHVLIKAFDALSRGQRLGVTINSNPLPSDWLMPESPQRYAEAMLFIPAAIIGNDQRIALRLEFKAGSIDGNSLAYWLYVKNPPQIKAQ